MKELPYILFLAVILLTNMIQGITGFAGTILAMPPSLMLVGYPVAKPILNVLGLLSGVYIFTGNYRHVCWKELRKLVAVMTVGILIGIFLKERFSGQEQAMNRLLGLFVLCLSIQGWFSLKGSGQADQKSVGKDSPALYLLLALAGIAHGIFVSGGPLLIGYLTKKIRDKVRFRATISTAWIFLNSLILADDIRTGLWNTELFLLFLCTLPFLIAGMWIGGRLYTRMSQIGFMKITYALLFISGITLLIK